MVSHSTLAKYKVFALTMTNEKECCILVEVYVFVVVSFGAVIFE